MEQFLNNHDKRKVDKKWEVLEPWPWVPPSLSYDRPHVIMAYILNQNLWAIYSVWFCVQQWSKCGTVLHQHLWFKKVCAQMVTMLLCRLNMRTGLNWKEKFLERIMTRDWMWVQYFIPESKQSSMEWSHKGSPPQKEFKAAVSWQEHDRSVFWDWGRVIHLVQWMHSITVTCFAVMCPGRCRRKDPKLSKNITLLHDTLIQIWRWQQWAEKLWMALLTALS